MINSIKKHGVVALPSRKEVLAWVAKVLFEIGGLPMLQNA